MKALKDFVQDGFTSLERGINSGVQPNLVGRNQVSFGVNCSFRGGYVTNRPGAIKLTLQYPNGDVQTVFETGIWQGAEIYDRFDGPTSILVSVSGRLFLLVPDAINYTVSIQEITISTPSSDPNPAANKICWMVQAESYMIVQDGYSVPIIVPQSLVSRRSLMSTVSPPEVPIGSQMSYGLGRLVVADGRQYVIGDIAYGATDVINFEENASAAEGGAYTVPFDGDITALRHTAVLDGQTTQGELVPGTPKGMASAKVGVSDRTTWKDIDFQRVATIPRGPTGQYSTVNVNSDIFFRSTDGVRSLNLSRQEFGSDWKNVPLSREINRILRNDDPSFLENASMAFWNNRVLVSVNPAQNPNNGGIYFQGIAVLDLDIISDLNTKTSPAWDGLWTGLQPYRIINGEFLGRDRCFVFHNNATGGIEMWEFEESRNDDHDDDGDIPIYSFLETRAYDFSPTSNEFELKKLETGELWINEVSGDVSFDVKYRPDEYPCWVDWHDFEVCAKTDGCTTSDVDANCPTVETFNSQYRSRLGFGTPADTRDGVVGRSFRMGYEFQLRLQWIGKAKIQKMILGAYQQMERPLVTPA